MGDISDGLARTPRGPSRDDVAQAAIWDALTAIEARLDMVEMLLWPMAAGVNPSHRHMDELAQAVRETGRAAAESRAMLAAISGRPIGEWEKRKAGIR